MDLNNNNNDERFENVQNNNNGFSADGNSEYRKPSPPPFVQPSYCSTGSGQMPYGYYVPNPEHLPQKKKSKGKKAGLIIAAVIIFLSVIFLTFAAARAISQGPVNNNENVSDNDNTAGDVNLDFSTYINGESNSPAGQIYQKTYRSNVGILVYESGGSSLVSEGSGVVLPVSVADGTAGGKTYIVTCAHVISKSSDYKTVIQTYDGTRYDAQIVGLDTKTDIGVLAVDATDLEAAEFAESSAVGVGDTVYALGNPGGSTFFGSFTNGMVSAIGRPVNSPVGYEVPCIQHTAAINPGNSGGALLNSAGQVIGVNSSKISSTEYEGMGFAVPSEIVKEIVENIIKNGYVAGRPKLGVQFDLITSNRIYYAVAQANNLPAGSLIIYDITDDSALKDTNIRKGDIIIGFNGKELDDYNAILNFVQNSKVGDKMTLTVCRIDNNYKISKFDVEITLVEDKG